ncbi:MAG: divalent-cation tolerance protein CutA [Saprospiraceae bacterium]|nr:divalent-cation tolerance protein CutA [Saprospiraceae bacterium]
MITVLYSTFPDKEKATEIGQILVKEKLVACANTFPVSSYYNWEGGLQEDEEYAAFFKTSLEMSRVAINRIKDLHPYDVPIITSETRSVNKEYEDWLKKELSKEE